MDTVLGFFQNKSQNIFGEENIWMLESFVVVFATLVGALFVSRILRRLNKRAELTHTLWDDALVGAIQYPAKWLVWVVGLSSAVGLAGEQSHSIILNSVDHVRYLAVVGIVTWFLVGLITRAERNFMSPEYCMKPMDQTTASAMGKLLRVSVIITALIIVLQYFQVEVSGILAFGGIGGIAVGFAAKDLLANFFGGLMIYLDRPFAVGDWIRSHDKEIEGTVEDIGWRLTRIRTFDKRPLYIPNSTFTQIAVENPSRMSNRRIYETIGIRYDDVSKMEAIVVDVRAMLLQHDDIAHDLTLMVNFNAFASSSLDFFIYCFTKTKNWAEFHAIKQDVLLRVLGIIDQHNAECAFPTSTLHIADGINVNGPSFGSVKESIDHA